MRSNLICKSALEIILEDNYPNFAKDLCATDQLTYHARRFKRFYSCNPCGQTKIKCAIGFDSVCQQIEYRCLTIDEGRIAFIVANRSFPIAARVQVISSFDGKILEVEPKKPTDLMSITLSTCLVAACTVVL